MSASSSIDPPDSEHPSCRHRGCEVSLWVWLVVFACGTALLTFRLDDESLWHDEGFTAAISGRSFAEIWQLRAVDNHSPLYYLTLHGFRLIAGDSVFALRLYSAIAGVALALVGPIWLRRAISPRAALWFSLLVFTTPIVLAFAQEARMYLPAAAALTGGVAAAFLAVRDQRRFDWASAFLLLVLACYFHIFAMLGAAVAGLGLVIWSTRLGRRQLAGCLALFLLVGLSYSFWLPTMLNRADAVSNDFWIDPPGWQTLGAGAIYPFMLRFAFSPMSIVAALLALAFLIVGGWQAIRRDKKKIAIFAICLATYDGVFLLAVAISFAGRPIFAPHYLTPLVGLLLIALAIAIDQFPGWWRTIAIATLIAVNLPMIARHYSERHYGPINEVATHIGHSWQPGDVIIHTGEATAGAGFMSFRSYPQFIYRDDNSRFYSPLDVYEPEIEVLNDLDQIAPFYRRIWILKGVGHLNTIQAEAAAREFGVDAEWTLFRQPDSWFGVDLKRIDLK